MMEGIESAIVSALAALGTGFVGWFFGRKKQKADTSTVEIMNIGKALLIFQNDIVEPLRQELKSTRDDLQNTRDELGLARQEIDNLRKDIEILHEENKQLKEQYQK